LLLDDLALRPPIARPQQTAGQFLQTVAQNSGCGVLPAIAPIGRLDELI
jgi:hypothetical protein